MTTYWKFLNADMMPTHGTGQWEVGVWRTVQGPVVPCKNGIHACREQDLVTWMTPYLYPVALDGDVIDADDKVVARSGCVGPRLMGWNEQTMRLFAADCAARVVHLNRDPRVTAAIIIARGRAFDLCGAAAWAAAWAAAGAAAWAAAGQWQGHRLLAYACGGIDLDAELTRTKDQLPWALKVVGL